jgi:hypothetical protein
MKPSGARLDSRVGARTESLAQIEDFTREIRPTVAETPNGKHGPWQAQQQKFEQKSRRTSSSSRGKDLENQNVGTQILPDT